MNPVVIRVVICLLVLSCGPTLHEVPKNVITEPGVLLSLLAARKTALPTLSAVARVESWSEEGGLKGRVTIEVDPAGRVRFDAWSPTDDLLASMSANRNIFGYFERGSSECLIGSPCPQNLSRMLPLGLGIEDACLALFGIPPLPATLAPSVSFDRRLGAYVITSTDTQGTVRIWITERGAVLRYERHEQGRFYTMECDDYAEISGILLPHKLHFTAEPGRRDITIKYRSVEIGTEMVDEFECPKGVLVRYLPCEGGEQ